MCSHYGSSAFIKWNNFTTILVLKKKEKILKAKQLCNKEFEINNIFQTEMKFTAKAGLR